MITFISLTNFVYSDSLNSKFACVVWGLARWAFMYIFAHIYMCILFIYMCIYFCLFTRVCMGSLPTDFFEHFILHFVFMPQGAAQGKVDAQDRKAFSWHVGELTDWKWEYTTQFLYRLLRVLCLLIQYYDSESFRRGYDILIDICQRRPRLALIYSMFKSVLTEDIYVCVQVPICICHKQKHYMCIYIYI
jgi:hypothetical protein